MMKKFLLIVCVMTLGVLPLEAALVKKTVEYQQGETVLEGYLVYDDAQPQQQLPGVLVVHEWMGLNDYAKSRADQLAQLGYVAFAVDIYGKGVRPNTVETASAEAGKYKSNRQLLRDRIQAGLDELKKQNNVDVSKIAAIGYCFGGTTVLELARSGSDIQGVVSFHGGLSQGEIDNKPMKTDILVLHGEADPFVPVAEVEAFKEEMRQANARMSFVGYPGAVHGFTNPHNTGEIPGALYDAQADAQSWEAMKQFLNKIFAGV